MNSESIAYFSMELAQPPGRYEYRFVANGQWVDDPAAKETPPNPFGELNAVVVVMEATNRSHAKLQSLQRWYER